MKKMWIGLAVFMAAAPLCADKKPDGKFSPGAAASYKGKQTNDSVTVAAAAYDTEELVHSAFGKLDPNQYGVLPVLVIIQNDTDQALKLDTLQVDYTDTNGRHVEATPPADVQTLGTGVRRPHVPNGSPIPHRAPKNPLSVPEIDTRSFAAKMLAPHESASGFFYFQVDHRPGSKFFLTGIKAAATGKDFFFFEIPLDYHR